MTTLLEKAVSRISELPPEDQDALASLILEEMDSEKRWDHQFANSQDQLAKLAAQAISDFKAGKTKSLDPDRDF